MNITSFPAGWLDVRPPWLPAGKYPFFLSLCARIQYLDRKGLICATVVPLTRAVSACTAASDLASSCCSNARLIDKLRFVL